MTSANEGSEMRIGIAGAGMVAAVHADAARRAGAVVAGVSASTPSSAAAAAGRLGALRGFDSSEELVTSDDIDVVHICTPNAAHGPLVRLALAAGKDVVCEKPLATTAREAGLLAELAADAGLVAAVPFVNRYHPMAAEARARAHVGSPGDSGTGAPIGSIGPIRLIHGHYLQDWLSEATDGNWRVDAEAGGASRAFADIGSHWCDLVEWVTGHRIAEVTAIAQTVFDRRPAASAATFSAGPAASGAPAETIPVTTEDAVQLMFRTDHGATGNLTVSQVSPGRKNRLWFELDGASASIVFDQENPETLWIGGRRSTVTVHRDAPDLSAAAAGLSAVPAGHGLGYRDCFAAFTADVYAAVRDRSAPRDFPSFADAARMARLTEAVLESARTRTWIGVEEQ